MAKQVSVARKTSSTQAERLRARYAAAQAGLAAGEETVAQAAKRHGVARVTVAQWIRFGWLTPLRKDDLLGYVLSVADVDEVAATEGLASKVFYDVDDDGVVLINDEHVDDGGNVLIVEERYLVREAAEKVIGCGRAAFAQYAGRITTKQVYLRRPSGWQDRCPTHVYLESDCRAVLPDEATLDGQQAVANYLKRSLAYVSESLVRPGLLTPIEGIPGRRQSFRVTDVNAAHEERQRQTAKAQQTVVKRAQAASVAAREARTAKLRKGEETTVQAAERLRARSTINGRYSYCGDWS